MATPALTFFYQTVGPFINGVGKNEVYIGSTSDGVKVDSYGVAALGWEQGPAITDSYGDPVISRLPNGKWTLTSWTTQDDPRGAGAMLYHEADCPIIDDANVTAINPSWASGCVDARVLQIGKTSQVFAVGDDTYVFHTVDTYVHLAHLSDANHSATELSKMCVLPTPVETIADLTWGESTPIITSDDLLLSDTAIAQRADGTWVLFVKGIEKNSSCKAGSGLCELCARSIYRTTSSDLIHWSELAEVVTQASVPEATQTVDGQVWLYWQDFSNACATQDQQLAAIAPISGAYETDQDYTLSQPQQVSFPDEAFETDNSIHYATNGNPVMLPDAAAQAALEACVQ
jgi:hypothetical protein